eukprot:CAMPEP_0183431988 /NCGR_PEP_ID=MMETSP0370-20130417/55364_1 /TAXON_ID=268820 /ORGANISM="Peridinium aciculiferum, Strain PAER-2" /LENGTH=74 /DNA_ID=CAMNT_0025617831 /DNA_START=48 /DNA_END=269 /DNA_ORIENTATION=-
MENLHGPVETLEKRPLLTCVRVGHSAKQALHHMNACWSEFGGSLLAGTLVHMQLFAAGTWPLSSRQPDHRIVEI